jgi:hypothetical protein
MRVNERKFESATGSGPLGHLERGVCVESGKALLFGGDTKKSLGATTD